MKQRTIRHFALAFAICRAAICDFGNKAAWAANVKRASSPASSFCWPSGQRQRTKGSAISRIRVRIRIRIQNPNYNSILRSANVDALNQSVQNLIEHSKTHWHVRQPALLRWSGPKMQAGRRMEGGGGESWVGAQSAVEHEFQAQIAAVRDVECELVRCLPRFIPQFVFVTQLCSPCLPRPSSTPRRRVCCRAMDDKDNLLSCLSPRVRLDWQLRLQHASTTSANILVSFTVYFLPTSAFLPIAGLSP